MVCWPGPEIFLMNVSALTNTQQKSALQNTSAINPSQTLGVDDFLKLLTVQLQNQDPLKPMEDTAFISQMASFTSLQQTKALTSDFEAFSQQASLTAANSLLGHYVSVFDPALGTISGKVSSVTIYNGTPGIVVNGVAYDLETVTNVTSDPPVAVPITSTP